MSRHVPDFINPVRAAEGGFSISGQLAFSRMKRLLEVVNNPDGVAELDLNFAVDGQGTPNVRGWMHTDVDLICQRCLEPMQVSVDVNICLGIVASEEEARRLPEQYDPLVARNEQLMIAEMVEDEILLALPSIPRHDAGECTVREDGEKRQSGAGDSVEDSANPFAVLAKLKAKR